MDIRCPNCNTLYEFDEARLKGGSVNLKCSQCSHIFRVEAPKAKQDKPRKRWMVRNQSTGDILYFAEMTQLQKWIIDRSVSRSDEISKTGKTWKPLGSIRELASLFEVADNIQRLQPGGAAQPEQTRPPHKQKHTPPPQADFFDPNAPGEPADAPPPAEEAPPLPPPPEDSPSPWSAETSEPTESTEPSSSWSIDVSAEADDAGSDPSLGVALPPALSEPEGPTTSSAFATSSPDEPGFKTGDFRSIGTLDDSLDLPPQRSSSLAVPLLVVALLLIIGGGGFYLYSTGAFGELSSSASVDTNAASTDTGTDAALTTASAEQQADSGEEIASADTDPPSESDAATDVATVAASTDADTPSATDTSAQDTSKAPDTTKVAARTTDKGNNTTRPSGEGGAARSFNMLMKQGYEHRRNGRPQEALTSFQVALQKRPGSPEAQTAIGWCYLGMSRTTLAIAAFKQAIKANASFADAYVGLGHAYRASGQSAQALAAYRTYIKLSPQGPKANMARKLISRMEQ